MAARTLGGLAIYRRDGTGSSSSSATATAGGEAVGGEVAAGGRGTSNCEIISKQISI